MVPFLAELFYFYKIHPLKNMAVMLLFYYIALWNDYAAFTIANIALQNYLYNSVCWLPKW